MKKIYVNEEWCLGCRLCEYYCAFANTNEDHMALALKDLVIRPNIRVEGDNIGAFGVNCRHCEEAYCVQSCISGALTKVDGVVKINSDKCVSCFTCVLSCPYGCIKPNENSVMQKCELCTQNSVDTPACVAHCPNEAIVFEERS